MNEKPDSIRTLVLKFLKLWSDLEPTAADIARYIGHPYASSTVTAKLRELRKPKHGGHKIECWHCPEEESGSGYIYRYRLIS